MNAVQCARHAERTDLGARVRPVRTGRTARTAGRRHICDGKGHIVKRRRRARLAALAAGVALVVSGCSGGDSGGGSSKGSSQQLRIGTALTPTDSLDPNTATSPGIMMTISYIYGSLAATTDKGTKMRLAESITPNATADEWTVKLRKGLTYSDGTPVTGQDVLASFQHLAQAPEYKTLYGGSTSPRRRRRAPRRCLSSPPRPLISSNRPWP